MAGGDAEGENVAQVDKSFFEDEGKAEVVSSTKKEADPEQPLPLDAEGETASAVPAWRNTRNLMYFAVGVVVVLIIIIVVSSIISFSTFTAHRWIFCAISKYKKRGGTNLFWSIYMPMRAIRTNKYLHDENQKTDDLVGIKCC